MMPLTDINKIDQNFFSVTVGKQSKTTQLNRSAKKPLLV